MAYYHVEKVVRIDPETNEHKVVEEVHQQVRPNGQAIQGAEGTAGSAQVASIIEVDEKGNERVRHVEQVPSPNMSGEFHRRTVPAALNNV
jgi:hypothetical protein